GLIGESRPLAVVLECLDPRLQGSERVVDPSGVELGLVTSELPGVRIREEDRVASIPRRNGHLEHVSIRFRRDARRAEQVAGPDARYSGRFDHLLREIW